MDVVSSGYESLHGRLKNYERISGIYIPWVQRQSFQDNSGSKIFKIVFVLKMLLCKLMEQLLSYSFFSLKY